MNDEQRRILEFVSVLNIINDVESNPKNPKIQFKDDGSTDLVFPGGEIQNFNTLQEVVEVTIAQISISGYKAGMAMVIDLLKAGKPIPEEGPSENDLIM